FEQDLRVGRTTCSTCGRHNPPYGHVNSFSLGRLLRLFQSLRSVEVSYVGSTVEVTNGLATYLMDVAGNPWGIYDQAEPCVHCGAALTPPQRRHLVSRVLSKTAAILNNVQGRFHSVAPIWVHVVFQV